MRLDLTNNERLNFQYILPSKGSFKTLETIERILDIIKIQEVKETEDEKTVSFEFKKEDIDFLKEVISVLDQNQSLTFQSLSLIRKIMNTKEQKI